MSLLTQNIKMKKSSQNGITVVNWTIPAFQSKTGLRTCPNAGKCAEGCYARSGAYSFSNVLSAHEEKLALTQSETFVSEMVVDINAWLAKHKVNRLEVRIHDAGDFYSLEYFKKWIAIMNHFKTESRVTFYAYSKQVKMVKDFGPLPTSFRVIFSFGGKQDHLIDVNKDFHSRVFESLVDLVDAAYSNGTLDDRIASSGLNNKIGLVYHGVKNFENTSWDKVA